MSDEQPFTWVQFDQRYFRHWSMGRFGACVVIEDIFEIEGPKTPAANDERFEEKE